MLHSFAHWLSDNPSFIGPLADIGSYHRVLAAGPFSLPAAATMALDRPAAEVQALCKVEDLKADFRSSFDPEGRVVFTEALSGTYDLVYAPLYPSFIDKRALTGFLFDVHDSLEKHGSFIFSFLDSPRVQLEPEVLPLWFDDSVKLPVRRYTVDDMLRSLLTIGLGIRSIDEASWEGLGHVIELECTRL